ncbi:hypothetical protein ALC60_05169 [Trachymyrmex zeteki]|uniref:Uncharacterized protein n=1 Tax=Mycetomoellerius zeteki TaxID=64791 RepID=A0A151X697_9HYME|nr:hypothetical protein ALC60_05169 [Trachymyrmex zeteki]
MTTDEGTDEKTKVSKRASRRDRGLSDSTTSAASADAAGPTDVVCRIQHRALPVQPKGRIRKRKMIILVFKEKETFVRTETAMNDIKAPYNKRLISEMIHIKSQKHGINKQNDTDSLPESSKYYSSSFPFLTLSSVPFQLSSFLCFLVSFLS